MKVLIVAATSMELKLLVDEFSFKVEKNHFFKKYEFEGTEIDVLITGIGTTFTAFHLTCVLKDNTYNLVLNLGIAGSLSGEIEIGEAVNVVSEEFADLGIEKDKEFLTLFESGFMDPNEFPFEHSILKASDDNIIHGIKKVRGITTNKSHGRQSSINQLRQKFSAHVESMEGAAVFYVSKWFGVPCYQLRTISNYVEPRDSSKWNIPLALENLKEATLKVLKNLKVSVN